METMRTAKGRNCRYSRERICLIVYEEYAEYVGKKEESMMASRTKTNLTGSPEHKKSFFDILNKIDL